MWDDAELSEQPPVRSHPPQSGQGRNRMSLRRCQAAEGHMRTTVTLYKPTALGIAICPNLSNAVEESLSLQDGKYGVVQMLIRLPVPICEK